MNEKKGINQLISENDDHIAASLLMQCFDILRDYPTVTKMKTCYNLITRVFRLFCVRGNPQDLEKMAKDIYEGLLQEIRNYACEEK